MIERTSCVFYHDSRCLLKGRLCDLICSSIRHYDMDDIENMDEGGEETWVREDDSVWFERRRTVSEEGADDT